MYTDNKLSGWADLVGTAITAIGTERASSRAAKATQADAAARIAEAQANVDVQRLALQAEALKAAQRAKGLLSNKPVMLGTAAALGGLLIFMVSRRRARR